MATILDVGPLTFFTPVLIWIFIFVILYALFKKFSIFGDEPGLHALVAVVFATLFKYRVVNSHFQGNMSCDVGWCWWP